MGIQRELRPIGETIQRHRQQPRGKIPPRSKGKRKPCLGCGREPGNLATGYCWNCRRERAKEG